MEKINRRHFIRNISIAGLPFCVPVVKPNDVLKFTLGFWEADELQQLFGKLLLPNVSLNTIEREGRVGLFTNGVVVGNSVEERGELTAAYLSKRPVLLPVPIANSGREVEKIKEISQQEEHRIGVISHFTYLQSVKQVQEIMRKELLSNVRQIDLLVNANEPDMMIGAGADGVLGWYFHPFSLATLFLESNPVGLEVRKATGPRPFSNIYFDFANGTKVNLSVKDDLDRQHWLMTLRGENSTLNLAGDNKINFKDAKGKTNLFNFDNNDYKLAMETLVLDYVKAVQEETEPPVGWELGSMSAMLQQAITLSAREEAYVHLNESSTVDKAGINLWEVQ